jgi:protein N-terminal glutamine amidohydrolase
VTDLLRYHPFYCEENAWWLCADPALGPGERHVLFVLSRAGRCPMLQQRVAPPGRLIAWDYHVVVVDSERQVWDQDSRLPLPCPGVFWLESTFALASRLPAIYAPRFRLIPAGQYLAHFASDRRHMRDRRGRYRQPPPPWPPIGEGSTLGQYLDPAAPEPGRLMGIGEIRLWMDESH